MFPVALCLTMFCQPGLPHGVFPGMTFEQVELRLKERPSCQIGTGPIVGGSSSAYFLNSGLIVHYKGGRVNCVWRASVE